MAQKKGQISPSTVSKKKEKNPPQPRTPMKRVLVLVDGRRKVLRWVPWS
jgi:hypothetical protein